MDSVEMVKVSSLILSAHSDLVPEMLATEYAELKADIERNGIQVPLEVCDGVIYDGRHRYRAACELEIEEVPVRQVEQRDEISLAEYIVRNAVIRRHLRPSQKAAIFLALHQLVERLSKEPGVVRENLARAAEVSGRTMGDVMTVASLAPDLMDEVRSGELSASRAAAFARRRVRDQVTKEEAKPTVQWGSVYHCSLDSFALLEPGSIDIIVCDAPSSRTQLPWYGGLALYAKKHLKVGGSLLVYTPPLWLYETLSPFHAQLDFISLLAETRSEMDPRTTGKVQLVDNHRNLLWYAKNANDMEKAGPIVTAHDSVLAQVFSHLSHDGEVQLNILDPWCNDDFFAVMAHEYHCNFVGIHPEESQATASNEAVSRWWSE